jgi:tetratricopeptide (TPR) repeat protein
MARTPRPIDRRGQAASPVVRLFVAGVVAVLFYGAILQGTASDFVVWLSPLVPNDQAAYEATLSKLEGELNGRLLGEHLALLDETDTVNRGIRQVNQLVSDALPEHAVVIAGELSRRALARIQEDRSRKDEAVALAQAATALAPNDYRAWQDLAEVYRTAERGEEARKLKGQIDDLRRRYPEVQPHHYAAGAGLPILIMALAYGLLGLVGNKPAEPAARTTEIRSVPVEDKGGGASLASSLEASRAAAAQAAGDVGPGPAAGGGKITQVLGAEERLEQAALLLEEGQWEDAVPVFNKAIQLNPALTKKVAALCVVTGKKLYDQGNLETAERAFGYAAERDPNDIRAHTYLANCKVKQGDFQGATEHYLHVCSIDPQGAIGFYNLGICYEKVQDLDSAIKAFQHTLTLDPNLANAHFYLGKIHESRGEAEKAKEHWRSCAELAPGTPQGERAKARLQTLGA